MSKQLGHVISMWINPGGGPRLDPQLQHYIAKHTYPIREHVGRLYRGTYVNRDTIKKGQKTYAIRTLQSWTTNHFTAKVFASGGKPPDANNSATWKTKVPVVFVSRKIKSDVHGINVAPYNKDPTPEIILNRPVFIAFYKDAYMRNDLLHVPVEIFMSSKKEIKRSP